MPKPSFSAADRDRSIVGVPLSLTFSFDENLCRNGFIFDLLFAVPAFLGEARAYSPGSIVGGTLGASALVVIGDEAELFRLCSLLGAGSPAVLAAASAPLPGEDLTFASRGRGEIDEVG